MRPEERLGRLIRYVRLERSMTQRELADRLGIARRTLQRWERGEGTVPLAMLGPLATALEVDPRLFAVLPLRGWRAYLL